MIARIFQFGIEQFLRRVRFPEQVGEDSAATTREIMAAFEAGIYTPLESPRKGPNQAAELVPWHRRDFFWEGTALGLAGLHCLRFSRGNPDRFRLTDIYRQMHYTGYGFWNGLGRVYPLPVLSLDGKQWSDVPDFPKYGPFIAGGIGFSLVATIGAFDDRVLAKLDGPALPGWKMAGLHGCGRALWFLYMHNTPRLEEVLNAYPQHAEMLLEGLGIAITYTQLASAEKIIKTVNRFSPAHREVLLRGVGGTLTQMPEDNPDLLRYIEGMAQGPLRRPYQACRQAALRAATGAEWYPSFIRLIREFMAETKAVGI